MISIWLGFGIVPSLLRVLPVRSTLTMIALDVEGGLVS